eukprot:COSAG01_NODE_10_length_42970_cov_93.010007_35_plen_49_part_00
MEDADLLILEFCQSSLSLSGPKRTAESDQPEAIAHALLTHSISLDLSL